MGGKAKVIRNQYCRQGRESLAITVRGTTPTPTPFIWPWEKAHCVLGTDSKHIWHPIGQHHQLTGYHTSSWSHFEFSVGHSTVSSMKPTYSR